MKKIMLIIFSIILVFYFIVALFFYFKQESFLFHPVKTGQDFTYKFPDNFEEIFYKTPNNGRIHTLRFTVEKPKGIVLYLHGNAGNLEDWAWVYQQYTSRNYDVEIIDYRSYGKSSGPLSEANLHDDVSFVYKRIVDIYGEAKVVLHGRSIGTGMATKLASETKQKALILESPYFNIVDIAKNIAPFLPLNLMLKYKFENNIYLKKVNTPIYILHGKLDAVIPFKSGKKLFDAFSNKADFIVFENGTHSNLATFEKYQLFLDEVLK